jgi:hypothetical protein
MSVRFSDDQAQALKAAMDVSACAIVRVAMDEYIDRRCAERASQRRRGRAGERAWGVFDLLTRPGSTT